MQIIQLSGSVLNANQQADGRDVLLQYSPDALTPIH